MELTEDETGYYSQACYYNLQGNDKLALEALQHAIEYAPRQCRLEAKYNPDFNRLRQDERFQSLINLNDLG